MQRDLFVTVANEGFVEQAKQVFAGAHFRAHWHGDLMLLAHNIAPASLQWFQDRGILVRSLNPICSDAEWRKCNYSTHPPTVSLKLHLFGPAFRKWRSIVYVDCDTLIRHPINRLTTVKHFGAVKDYGKNLAGQFAFVRTIGTRQEIKKRYDLSTPSFNTGVFAFRPDTIEHDALDRLIELYNAYGPMSRFGEQLILNLFFYKQWERLPPRYNSYIYDPSQRTLPLVAPIVHRIATILVPPGIILHFPIGLKPWEKESSYFGEWSRNRAHAETISLPAPNP